MTAGLFSGPGNLSSVLTNRTVRRIVKAYCGHDAAFGRAVYTRLGSGIRSARDYVSGTFHHDRLGRRLRLFVLLSDSNVRPLAVARGSHRQLYHQYLCKGKSKLDCKGKVDSMSQHSVAYSGGCDASWLRLIDIAARKLPWNACGNYDLVNCSKLRVGRTPCEVVEAADDARANTSVCRRSRSHRCHLADARLGSRRPDDCVRLESACASHFTERFVQERFHVSYVGGRAGEAYIFDTNTLHRGSLGPAQADRQTLMFTFGSTAKMQLPHLAEFAKDDHLPVKGQSLPKSAREAWA